MSHEGIPTDEMLQDIRDTEAEIATMEREEEGFRLLGDRWSVMRADMRVEGVAQRREFIEKVRQLIKARDNKEEMEAICPQKSMTDYRCGLVGSTDINFAINVRDGVPTVVLVCDGKQYGGILADSPLSAGNVLRDEEIERLRIVARVAHRALSQVLTVRAVQPALNALSLDALRDMQVKISARIEELGGAASKPAGDLSEEQKEFGKWFHSEWPDAELHWATDNWCYVVRSIIDPQPLWECWCVSASRFAPQPAPRQDK